MRIEANTAVREHGEYQNSNVVNSKESIGETRDLPKPEEEKGQDIGQRPLVELLKSEYDINFQQVIRQIPPEELLDLAVKLQEMIGFLIDQRI